MEYIQSLDFHASNSSLARSIASVAPCFYLYKELGIKNSINNNDDSVYAKWLQSYKSESFLMATEIIMDLYLTYGYQYPDLHNDMLLSFVDSAKLEFRFLESCMKGQDHVKNYYFSKFLV